MDRVVLFARYDLDTEIALLGDLNDLRIGEIANDTDI
jgi:hypothetical protein